MLQEVVEAKAGDIFMYVTYSIFLRKINQDLKRKVEIN